MKIAVASSGKTIDSEVSPISGRAEYYLIFENKKLIKTIKNPFQFGGGGAGIGVAQMLHNEGVKLIISGKMGPKMEDFIRDKKIKHKSLTGKTVKEVINAQA
ncbi:NifB/NifX family molybdenum-iron cluster-binding protein [Candidatus Woesearchaeota archaeon]|nr:NifB/NifX family molybdenum-iron cluster-binding protein [Candidatus Woesearchaeota archaeon]